MIDIILIEPEHSGNLGAVARVVKNFGFEKLVLVNPKCKVDQEARNRAKWANDVLDNVKIVSRLVRYDYLVATSSKIGRDYNIKRVPISIADFASKVNEIKDKKVGIVFGREGIGLRNDEIAKCDFVVTIPANKEYSVLNLSHSVGVICYELFQVLGDDSNVSHIEKIGEKEKKELLKLVNKKIMKMGFESSDKKKTQKILWKKLINKSFLSRREAFALFGFFKKLK